jgi:hypothetical protein
VILAVLGVILGVALLAAVRAGYDEILASAALLVRHEAPCDRAEMEGLRLRVVAAA